MTLQDALIQAVDEFGKEVLLETRLLNIISDYRGFDDFPAARHILGIMQNKGYIQQLTESENLSQFIIEQIMSELCNRYGLSNNAVSFIVSCIRSAVSDTVSTDYSDEESENGWTDEFGVTYSMDKYKLFYAPDNLSGCYVVRPETRIICDMAFCGCDSLQSVSLPQGLTHIGDDVFGLGLRSITLPKSLKHLGSGVFYLCDNLEVINLSSLFLIKEKGIYTHEGKMLFSYFGKEESISLPQGLTHIGDGAFAFCESLQSISLPHGLTHIGDDAFMGCKSLQSISLPQGLTHIGNDAFRRCKSLKSISIPQGVTHIGDGAFYDCASLQSVYLPQGLEHIGVDSFGLCKSLNSIFVPRGSYWNYFELLPPLSSERNKLAEL